MNLSELDNEKDLYKFFEDKELRGTVNFNVANYDRQITESLDAVKRGGMDIIAHGNKRNEKQL